MGARLHAAADKGRRFAAKRRQMLGGDGGHRRGAHAGDPATVHDAERQGGGDVTQRHQRTDIRQTALSIVGNDAKKLHPSQPVGGDRARHCME
jgi:hypothetical protein